MSGHNECISFTASLYLNQFNVEKQTCDFNVEVSSRYKYCTREWFDKIRKRQTAKLWPMPRTVGRKFLTIEWAQRHTFFAGIVCRVKAPLQKVITLLSHNESRP